jgi:hypothetical protein
MKTRFLRVFGQIGNENLQYEHYQLVKCENILTQ